tara:strand:+ start:6774 stop:6935 length:162 start_codon:yes stop_codon:yes gene_type:complete
MKIYQKPKTNPHKIFILFGLPVIWVDSYLTNTIKIEDFYLPISPKYKGKESLA